MAEANGLLAGQDDDFAGAFGESFEHERLLVVSLILRLLRMSSGAWQT
jgi:hypothetical protein